MSLSGSGSNSSDHSDSSDYSVSLDTDVSSDSRQMTLRANQQKQLRQQRMDLDVRLAEQQKIMAQFRTATPGEVGGLVSKWMGLANLNAENLAGQTIAQIFFDMMSFFLQKEHQTDVAIYKKAGENIAYVNQTIYHCDEDGKPDFSNPYSHPHEEISTIDIYQNGYIPPANLRASLPKELGQTIQGFMGPKAMGKDLLVSMFGVNAAREVLKPQPIANTTHNLLNDNTVIQGQQRRL